MPGPDPAVEHGHFGLGMVLIHLVVGVLTGWWLYRGERALWLMLRLWGMPQLSLRDRVQAVIFSYETGINRPRCIEGRPRPE